MTIEILKYDSNYYINHKKITEFHYGKKKCIKKKYKKKRKRNKTTNSDIFYLGFLHDLLQHFLIGKVFW